MTLTSTATNSTLVASSTLSSFSPLQTITTKEPPPGIAEQVKLTVDDLAVAGHLLGVVVAISIIMNIYTIVVVSKNWNNMVQFPFSQSNIICMFLSLADLLLGFFLGLPTAIHLRFAEYFSEQHLKIMVHYSRIVGYFLLDYMFLFRSIIIAVICIDRCVHILRPLAYKFRVSHRLTVCICAAMVLFPLITRVTPQIIILNVGGENTSHIVCSAFRNPDPLETLHQSNIDIVNFTVPLTCNINVWVDGVKDGLGAATTKASLPGRIAAAEVVLFVCTLVLTFLSIIICNAVILVVIVRRFKARKVMTCNDQGAMKKKVKLGIQKNLLATSIMAFVFLLSNGPFVVIWVVDYLVYFLVKTDVGEKWKSGDDKLRLYLTMCMFLSLLVNPWLYPLRMETIRKFFPCFKPSFSDTIRRKFSDTRTQISSRLFRQMHSPTTGKKTSQSNLHGQRNGNKASRDLNPPLSHFKDDSIVMSNSKTLRSPKSPPSSPSFSLQRTMLSSVTEVIELDQIGGMDVGEARDNSRKNGVSHSLSVGANTTEMEI